MTAIIQNAMGHSQHEKTASHERIVSTTAAQIRESGTEQPAVAEIMRAAGLTHGGFYKHFASRDDLIAEAVDHALTENEPTIERIIAEADDPLAAFADWYVSAAHRDDPASGCGVAALGADVQRAGGASQEAYRAQVERYLAHLQTMFGDNEPKDRRQAMVTLSAMVGAVMIARALGRTARSDELLQDVREAVRERRLLPE
jgi:TetR/AcrR family transcriptional repressor of nem operon